MKTNKLGFSLIELLVALSILAVVAAIIVPRFLNVRQQATQTAALANLRQLQSTCQQFVALGGSIGSSTTAAANDGKLAANVLNYISGTTGRATATAAGTAFGAGSGTTSTYVCDSQGVMGSFTIQWAPVPGTSAVPTAASNPAVGFYVGCFGDHNG